MADQSRREQQIQTPDQLLNAPPNANAPVPGADAPPDLYTAIQQQLGLKLDSKKESLRVLVVDHAEKIPTEN